MMHKQHDRLIADDLDRLIRHIAFNNFDVRLYNGKVLYIFQTIDHEVADRIRANMDTYSKDVQKRLRALLKDISQGEEQGRVHCLGKMGRIDWSDLTQILIELEWYDNKKPLFAPDQTMPPLNLGYLGFVLKAAGYQIDVI